MKLWTMALVALMLAVPAAAQDKGAKPGATSDSGATNMEILRQKIKADKKLVVAANMSLTEAEAKQFWPVYDAYQKDLQQINERTGKAIVAYADAYKKGAVDDATAKKLLEEFLAIEDSELKLKRSYVPKLEKVVPMAKAARYLQIENKIRALVKYELAANIPLVE
jgi:Spy/CpxP family protein refolding chaperone